MAGNKKSGFPLLILLGSLLILPLSSFIRTGNSSYRSQLVENPVSAQIYLINNGWHQEIALPLRDCAEKDLLVGSEDKGPYLLIGWGDREFFLNTPYLRMLTLKKTVWALFFPSESVLKVSFLKGTPRVVPGVTRIPVTEEMLCRLYELAAEEKASPDPLSSELSHPAYGEALFFMGKSYYSILFTCNNWSGRVLKKGGIPSGLWTPWTAGVGPSKRLLEKVE